MKAGSQIPRKESVSKAADFDAPLYIFARFEPKKERENEVREELAQVVALTRREPGCVRIDFFESVQKPSVFFIHSEWVNEAAFERHTHLDHTVRFIAAVSRSITHEVQAVRTKRARKIN